MVKNKNHYRFELQLVVIGILIPVYLYFLPMILKPISSMGHIFEFILPKTLSYLMGISWLICLLFGTFSLIEKKDFLQEKSDKIYNLLFIFNNIFTLFSLIILVISYTIVFLTLGLLPYFIKQPIVSLTITITLVIGLIILTSYMSFKKTGKEGK